LLPNQDPQYKVIWQNAGIEIAEADKLVFIGYSLPSADYEMRQLLSRMTRKNATIEVVDHCTEIDKQQPKKNHWRKFFGDREISFHFGGAKAYLDALKCGTHKPTEEEELCTQMKEA